MSGIIHITPSRGAFRTLGRAACIAAPIAALIVYATHDSPPPHRTVDPAAFAMPAPAAATAAPATVPTARPPIPTGPIGFERAAPATPTPAMAAEFAQRNARIDVRQLTQNRPAAARAFLDEVVLETSPKGGYVVAEVLPDSRHDRLGVRPGDVVYSLDTPATAQVDETSMIALTRQSDIELDVYRNGTLVHLRYSLGDPPQKEVHADAQ